MTAADSSQDCAELGDGDSHAGLPAFRGAGKKLLRWPRKQEVQKLDPTLEQQATFVKETPEIFLLIP